MENDPYRKTFGDTLVEIAKAGALKVAPYVLTVFKQGILAEEKKGYYDLVTEADRTTEALLTKHLSKAFPDSCFMGEENGVQGSGSVCWIIDPIDGTNNFVSGLPLFCISIGAVVDEKAIAGVIYDPVRKEMFSASPGGAFLNGTRLQSSGPKNDHSSLISIGFPYEGGNKKPAEIDLYRRIIENFQAVRRLGSTALELAYVAAGRIDVTFNTHANPWDVAAGLVLIEQSGGHYTVPRGSTSPWKSPSFIASCANFDLGGSVLKDVFDILLVRE
ncbi:inositol monophosphatase [bacterium]|nr:inositol monophosphatase [bacterium]